MENKNEMSLLQQTTRILIAPTVNTKRLILLFTNITFFLAIVAFIYSQGGFKGLPDPGRDVPVYLLLLIIHGFSFLYNLTVLVFKRINPVKLIDRITTISSVAVLLLMSQMIVHSSVNTSVSLLIDFSFSLTLIAIVAFLWGRIAAIIWTVIVLASLIFAVGNINKINFTGGGKGNYSYNLLTKKELQEFNGNLVKEIVAITGALQKNQYPKKVQQRVAQMLNLKSYLSRPDIMKVVYIPKLIRYVRKQNMDEEMKNNLLSLLSNAKSIRRFQQLIKEKKVPIPLPLVEVVWIVFICLLFFPVFFQSSMLGNILNAVPKAITNIEKASREQQKLLEENLRLGAEVGIAKQIQEMALPNEEEYNYFKTVDVNGFMVSSAEVGGDYYEVIPDADNNSCFMAIGDVTDHGLQSGVVMLMTQTAFRTALETTDNLVDAMVAVNKAVYENTERMKDSRNLTLSLIHYKNSILNITGQHESILLLKKSSDVIDEISTSDLGMYVGMVPDIREYCSQISFRLNKDDIVVFYTDGVTEAENPSKEFYGIDRLKSVILSNRDLDSVSLNKAIYEDIKRFIGSAPVYDDITLLSLKGRESGGNDDQSKDLNSEKGVIQEMKGDSFENKKNIDMDKVKLETIKFYGEYNHVPEDFIADDSFYCSLRASDLINNWHRCGLISDNLSNYFSHYKENEKEKKNLINVFSTISNELIENLAKFSDKRRNKIRISVNKYASIFCIETENFVQKNTVDRFEKFISKILDKDANHEEMYMDTLVNRKEDEKGSGLGYLMMLKDFPVKVGCSLSKVSFLDGQGDEDQSMYRINIRTYLFWEEV